MKNDFTLHASKFGQYANGVIGLGLVAFWICFVYRAFTGDPSVEALLETPLFAAYFLGGAVALRTTVVTYHDGILLRHNVFLNQSVDLTQLTRARKYLWWGKRYIFRLDDSAGGYVRIVPMDYGVPELNTIVDTIRPYIFIPRVDKNFIVLRNYVGDEDYPKQSFLKVIGKTFLYVILPCVVITAAVIAWAIITKQPAFR
jgi:hypothetical protein